MGLFEAIARTLIRRRSDWAYQPSISSPFGEGDKRAAEAFEKAVMALNQVVQAQRLFGDPDYHLQVIAKDLSAFQRLYDADLSSLLSVHRRTSTLMMKQVAVERPLFPGGTQ